MKKVYLVNKRLGSPEDRKPASEPNGLAPEQRTRVSKDGT